MTLSDRILALLNENPGYSDREITDALLGKNTHPSPINQACRALEATSRLSRVARADGVIGNYPSGVPVPKPKAAASRASTSDEMSEDEVKLHLKTWLEAAGWTTEIAWGKARGADIVARSENITWLIEAKGCGSRPEMRVNYFVGMLGELLQRMSIDEARYSIALPDMPQFRRLWNRLPALARKRAQISALFVSADGRVEHLGSKPAPDEITKSPSRLLSR